MPNRRIPVVATVVIVLTPNALATQQTNHQTTQSYDLQYSSHGY